MGPCAAESRAQVLECAEELSRIHAQRPFIFRAGVWKPRTSPHTFQGVGEEALKWLREVKERFGLEVATEVATPEHVEAALRAGIDYLWIGARSSATPIVVQSLADSIGDLRSEISNVKGIFIKNPVNEDAALWLGNIERLEKTGVPVMAVHRGCGHKPCWAMAHKVRLARPDIPMLLDPSHMSGDAALVPALMQKIDELGLDGAMVEVHCHPEQALSDAKQQISPTILLSECWPFSTRFRLVFDSFSCLSTEKAGKEGVQDAVELQWLRAEMDEIDERLWETIAQRMEVSRRIGAWKKLHGVAPLQPQRYKEIVEKIKTPPTPLSEGEKGLRTEFKLALWEMIHEESLRQQS